MALSPMQCSPMQISPMKNNIGSPLRQPLSPLTNTLKFDVYEDSPEKEQKYIGLSPVKGRKSSSRRNFKKISRQLQKKIFTDSNRDNKFPASDSCLDIGGSNANHCGADKPRITHDRRTRSSFTLGNSSNPAVVSKKVFDPNCFITSPLGDWIVETNNTEHEVEENEVKDPFGDMWYNECFVGKNHRTFIGKSPDTEFCLSTMFVENMLYGYFRTPKCDLKKVVPVPEKYTSVFKSTLAKKYIIRLLELPIRSSHMQEVKSDKIIEELADLERKMVVNKLKFGVLYAKENQTAEEDMFSNEHGSQQFNKFLEILGDRILLQDWQYYSGGLDAKRGSTGAESVYTKWNGIEIMYHVSTLLPYSYEEPQQLERKRHLGNDVVCIIFQEGDGASYATHTISSQFIHVYCVVRPVIKDGKQAYGVQVARQRGVPGFAPHIENEYYFHDNELRTFLLNKLTMGELAAYKAPAIASKLERTKRDFLRYFLSTYN
eukprot:TRINITY_DN2765_c1_g1_i1.p1 TRINITY_DN2765_c1_g1~~TRINITY_DN2765_c1_g1_i1.p1  ORF type:complete len:557 (-),score=131.14 TRINITY_DN2765_c1_g1_i1:79-1542(-)